MRKTKPKRALPMTEKFAAFSVGLIGITSFSQPSTEDSLYLRPIRLDITTHDAVVNSMSSFRLLLLPSVGESSQVHGV